MEVATVHPTIFVTLIPDEDERALESLNTLSKTRDYADLLRAAAQKLDEIATKCNEETHISFPRLPMKVVLSAPPEVIQKIEKDPSKIIPHLDFYEDDGEE